MRIRRMQPFNNTMLLSDVFIVDIRVTTTENPKINKGPIYCLCRLIYTMAVDNKDRHSRQRRRS